MSNKKKLLGLIEAYGKACSEYSHITSVSPYLGNLTTNAVVDKLMLQTRAKKKRYLTQIIKELNK